MAPKFKGSAAGKVEYTSLPSDLTSGSEGDTEEGGTLKVCEAAECGVASIQVEDTSTPSDLPGEAEAVTGEDSASKERDVAKDGVATTLVKKDTSALSDSKVQGKPQKILPVPFDRGMNQLARGDYSQAYWKTRRLDALAQLLSIKPKNCVAVTMLKDVNCIAELIISTVSNYTIDLHKTYINKLENLRKAIGSMLDFKPDSESCQRHLLANHADEFFKSFPVDPSWARKSRQRRLIKFFYSMCNLYNPSRKRNMKRSLAETFCTSQTTFLFGPGSEEAVDGGNFKIIVGEQSHRHAELRIADYLSLRLESGDTSRSIKMGASLAVCSECCKALALQERNSLLTFRYASTGDYKSETGETYFNPSSSSDIDSGREDGSDILAMAGSADPSRR